MSTTEKKPNNFILHVYKSRMVWYTRCFCLQKNAIMALCAFIVFLNQTVKSSYIVFRLIGGIFNLLPCGKLSEEEFHYLIKAPKALHNICLYSSALYKTYLCSLLQSMYDE